MSFQNLVTAAQKYFPTFQIKYKDQSSLMKFLGTLMFFNPSFMTNYTTTIGNTIYFVSENDVKNNEIDSCVTLLHETVHMYDQKRLGRFLFSISYLFPLILFPFAALLFLLSWKIALPAMLFFLLPLPAYWRMNYERRAYMVSLYACNKLGFNLQVNEAIYLHACQGTGYYFMWPFSNLKVDFDQAIQNIEKGQKPFQDPVFTMIDDLLSHVQ
jgi:hypothetical protein